MEAHGVVEPGYKQPFEWTDFTPCGSGEALLEECSGLFQAVRITCHGITLNGGLHETGHADLKR